MSEFIVVFVTVASSEEGERLAESLVEGRLAACVNRLGPMHSTYRWEGKIEKGSEELLMIKTRQGLFEQVKRRVQELHSYSVPEIIALPVVEGSEAYMQWLEQQVSEDGE